MKKRIVKLCGVGLVLMMLASLLVAAVPASAAVQAWSAQITPSALFNQIEATAGVADGTDVTALKMAPNGDLFCIDVVAAPNVIYKSVDGGVTWTAAIVVGAPANIIDLAISPSYATDGTVVALDSGAAGDPQVYISYNSGTTFAALGGAIDPAGAEIGTSIVIAPNYNAGVGEIMVGTQDPTAGGGNFGDVYIWYFNTVQTWTAQALAQDVTTVAYSPTYAIDGTRLAICSDTANGTRLRTRVAAAAWDATLAAVIIDAAILEVAPAAGTAIASSDLALPSNFNASSIFTRTCYVSTVSAGGAALDDVSRVTVGVAASAVAMAPLSGALLQAGGGDEVCFSLDYSGTIASGTLYAGSSAAIGGSGHVVQCSNPTVAAGFLVWTANAKAPTGSTAAVDVLVSGTTVYAGTTGLNSACSVSTDGGSIFYQTGLIDTSWGGILDFVAVDSSTWFLLSTDGGLGGTTADSLWKTTNAGLVWYRTHSVVLGANTGIVRISPEYASDTTVVIGDVGANAMYTASDGGILFSAAIAPGIAVGDIVVKDSLTYYVGGSAAVSVQSTSNGGWIWQPAATAVTDPVWGNGAGATRVWDLELDLGTGDLLAGLDNNYVLKSTNNNVSWSTVGFGIAAGATNVTVAFDKDYATNGMVYAAEANAAGATADVLRFGTGYTAWLAAGSAIAATDPNDILVAPDGTLYCTDITAANGMSRSLNAAAGTALVSTAGWDDAVGAGLAANSTLAGLSYAAGSNIIYGIDTTNNLIYAYTDELTQVSPVPNSPAEGAVVNAAAAVVGIDAVAVTPAAIVAPLGYQIQWDTRPDYLGRLLAPLTSQGNFQAIPFPLSILLQTAIAAPANNPPNGVTIYYRVRVNAPVMSPWSATYTLVTELVPVAVNAPAILSPAEGGTGPGGWNASLNPTFQWGTVASATGYEFQLASDVAMSNFLVNETLGLVNSYTLTSITLDYNTTYYWRVRGLGTSTNTDWTVVTAFTTKAAPVTTEAPVTVTQAPDITIEVPQATETQVVIESPEISSAYIWVIIAIGAILVIAVIILIVRTRRSA